MAFVNDGEGGALGRDAKLSLDDATVDLFGSHEIVFGNNIWLDSEMHHGMTVDQSSIDSWSSSLEESLHLYTQATHEESKQSKRLAEDEDINALFPMLSATSFDTSDGVMFPDHLSSEEHMDTALAKPSSSTTSLSMPIETIASTSNIKQLDVSHRAKKVDNEIPANAKSEVRPKSAVDGYSMTSLGASTSRKRRRLASSNSSSSTNSYLCWTEHEQKVFFTHFTTNWASSGVTNLVDILDRQFQLVSDALHGSKTVKDVKSFYTYTLNQVKKVVNQEEIELSHPDDICVSFQWWYENIVKHQKGERFIVDNLSEGARIQLGKKLKDTIKNHQRNLIRSNGNTLGKENDDSLPVLSLEGIFREALEHTNIVPPVNESINTVETFHQPMVRKKSVNKASGGILSTPIPFPGIDVTNHKPMQVVSVDPHEGPTRTPVHPRKYLDAADTHLTPQSTAHRSPTIVEFNGRQTPQSSSKKISIKFRMVPHDYTTRDLMERCQYNPKVELKLNSTKSVSDVIDHMIKKWARVQPFLPSDAVLHFYQKVGGTDSPGRGSDEEASIEGSRMTWSRQNREVSCLDIWRHCGKRKNDEYIVVVSYQWKSDAESAKRVSNIPDINASKPKLLSHTESFLDILDDNSNSNCSAKKLDFDDVALEDDGMEIGLMDSNLTMEALIGDLEKSRNNSLRQDHEDKRRLIATSETPTLFEFSESVAFGSCTKDVEDNETADEFATVRTSCTDSNSSPGIGRIKRRITPMLCVQTNECAL